MTSAVARDSSTGYPVITGDGQINFTVVLKDGYTLDSVTGSGAYKNLKDTGVENTYRLTKVTGAATVTVTTEKTETPPEQLLGDVNGDGKISNADAMVILRYVVKLRVAGNIGQIVYL